MNSSTYWGFLGAEISAVAYGAGAVQIKPLSAVPGLRKGMRSYSSHRPKGSCQLGPSGGCCLEKFPKGASALLFCLLLSSQLPPSAQAEKTQTFSFSGLLAVTRFRWRGKCQCYQLDSQCQLYDAMINCNFTDKRKTCGLRCASDENKLNQDFALRIKPRNDLLVSLGSFKMLPGIFY